MTGGGLARLHLLPAAEAEAAFLACCGSRRWARAMAAGRPYGSAADLAAAADRHMDSLDRADWLEAFAAHPRIGESGGASETAAWSKEEQAGAAAAEAAVRGALARANRLYDERFGYLFIVCASGKSAEEMLAILERRLGHDPAEELPIAAAEQRQITHLRLGKLLAG